VGSSFKVVQEAAGAGAEEVVQEVAEVEEVEAEVEGVGQEAGAVEEAEQEAGQEVGQKVAEAEQYSPSLSRPLPLEACPQQLREIQYRTLA